MYVVQSANGVITELWGNSPLPGPIAQNLGNCTSPSLKLTIRDPARVIALNQLSALSVKDFAQLYSVSSTHFVI